MNEREASLFETIRENGRLIKREHNLLFTSNGAGTDYKEDDTPVTRVDHAINESLMAWAHKNGYGYVGEEGNGALDREYVLYVDPLDGTVAFTQGMNTATIIVSIMLMDCHHEYGIPVSSIIHQPLGGHTWISSLDSKTHYFGPYFPKGVALQTTREKPEKIRTNICVFPDASHNLQAIKETIESSRMFRDQSMGAFGYSGGLIASDLLEATMIGATTAMESAAMSLVVANAGGVACDLFGESLTSFKFGEVNGKPDFELSNGALFASNQNVADMMLEIISTHQ